MASFYKQEKIAECKRQFGFVPPCGMGAVDSIYAKAQRDGGAEAAKTSVDKN